MKVRYWHGAERRLMFTIELRVPPRASDIVVYDGQRYGVAMTEFHHNKDGTLNCVDITLTGYP